MDVGILLGDRKPEFSFCLQVVREGEANIRARPQCPSTQRIHRHGIQYGAGRRGRHHDQIHDPIGRQAHHPCQRDTGFRACSLRIRQDKFRVRQIHRRSCQLRPANLAAVVAIADPPNYTGGGRRQRVSRNLGTIGTRGCCGRIGDIARDVPRPDGRIQRGGRESYASSRNPRTAFPSGLDGKIKAKFHGPRGRFPFIGTGSPFGDDVDA